VVMRRGQRGYFLPMICCRVIKGHITHGVSKVPPNRSPPNTKSYCQMSWIGRSRSGGFPIDSCII
jgi:hypothetical protein